MSDQTKRETSDETLDDVSGGMYTNPVPPHGIPPTHQPGAGHVRVEPAPAGQDASGLNDPALEPVKRGPAFRRPPFAPFLVHA